jgi:pimeloyl-ACP methyl ester carboxylesterase
MPDDGMLEDFLHVAGLLQGCAGNGTVRPFLVVGIEKTQRRRDLTGSTEIAKDRTIAPAAGGSQAYRNFIRTGLMPEVEKRYRVTQERAIVGESLAGLFVVETLALAPDLFNTYIAIDPSLWWNVGQLAKRLIVQPPKAAGRKALHIAASADGLPDVGATLKASLGKAPGLEFSYEAWPGKTHATVYHPAALKVFRALLKPRARYWPIATSRARRPMKKPLKTPNRAQTLAANSRSWRACGTTASSTDAAYLVKNTAIIIASGTQLPRTITLPAVVPGAVRLRLNFQTSSAVLIATPAQIASGIAFEPNFMSTSCSDSASMTKGTMNRLRTVISRSRRAAMPRQTRMARMAQT